ncbi:ELM1/GtrOC1 family putative glycosyltransferase [Dongia sedimenti]|uniref:ELM1/GtrOC1 family putative glycosyltransferase n=1 Tax=Dongia sedimenti TaxID=3064282 RepID=A0ABU0YPJ4_9PROT|nr:ELM1/GtrOC1 family putative glycosyltransferase [Rhodospirillaceae bacterium R-7]
MRSPFVQWLMELPPVLNHSDLMRPPTGSPPAADDSETDLILQDLRHAPSLAACVGWSPPEIWVVLTHASGDNDQCLALAEALCLPFRCIHLNWPACSREVDRARLMALLREDLPGRMWRAANSLHAPWPRLIICCGRRAGGLAFWIKRQSGGRAKVVTIGRAHRSLADYDLVVAPPQYMLPERANVIHLPILMGRPRTEIRAEPILASKPWFTLLLGGRVKQFVTSEAALRQAALRAALAAERTGGSVIVSASRRTPPWLLAAAEGELTAPMVYRWTGPGAENPYATLLQQSTAVFVTGDSPSMIWDACRAGAPTYLIELPDRRDIRRLWRRGLYDLIRNMARLLREAGLQGAARSVDRAQDWLHASRILRYPRDLRRFHAKVYEMGLARPAADFDPAAIPARRDVDALPDASAIRAVLERCLAWLSPHKP